MTIPEIIEVLIIERHCIERQDTPACNRDCARCDLALPADRVVRAYEEAIDAMHVLEQLERCDDDGK